MKSCIIVFIFITAICVILTGCSEPESVESVDADVDLVVLSDIVAQAQFQNILQNSSDFLGKTVRVRGPLASMFFNNQVYHYIIVIQGDDACCESEGFELKLSEDHMRLNDEIRQGTIIEVTGVLGSYREAGQRYVYLAIDGVEDIKIIMS